MGLFVCLNETILIITFKNKKQSYHGRMTGREIRV